MPSSRFGIELDGSDLLSRGNVEARLEFEGIGQHEAVTVSSIGVRTEKRPRITESLWPSDYHRRAESSTILGTPSQANASLGNMIGFR
jgi:hypothetical protein